MALKNAVGVKVSAKQIAEEIYAQAVNRAASTFTESPQLNSATEREIALVDEQMQVIGKRLLNKLHYEVEGQG